MEYLERDCIAVPFYCVRLVQLVYPATQSSSKLRLWRRFGATRGVPGVWTRCWTTGVVREGVRMYGRDDVELALYALEEGMGAGVFCQ